MLMMVPNVGQKKAEHAALTSRVIALGISEAPSDGLRNIHHKDWAQPAFSSLVPSVLFISTCATAGFKVHVRANQLPCICKSY